MKVYILVGDPDEFTEIIDVFDSLEKAQSYRDGKPEDWTTDSNSSGWWSRTATTTGLSMTVKTHLGIVEREVR